MKERNYPQYRAHYSNSGFWAKLKRFSRKMGEESVARALMLYYVMREPTTPLLSKMKIAGALGYLILPIDAVPDFIPMAGFTDDAAALLWALSEVSSHVTDEIRKKAHDKARSFFAGADEKKEIEKKKDDEQN